MNVEKNNEPGIEEKNESDKLEPNAGNGCDLPNYSWTQTLSKIELNVPILADFKTTGLSVDITEKRIKLGLKGCSPIIKGELYNSVKVKECCWFMKNSKTLVVTLEKANKYEWWSKIITTDPEINIEKGPVKHTGYKKRKGDSIYVLCPSCKSLSFDPDICCFCSKVIPSNVFKKLKRENEVFDITGLNENFYPRYTYRPLFDQDSLDEPLNYALSFEQLFPNKISSCNADLKRIKLEPAEKQIRSESRIYGFEESDDKFPEESDVNVINSILKELCFQVEENDRVQSEIANNLEKKGKYLVHGKCDLSLAEVADKETESATQSKDSTQLDKDRTNSSSITNNENTGILHAARELLYSLTDEVVKGIESKDNIQVIGMNLSIKTDNENVESGVSHDISELVSSIMYETENRIKSEDNIQVVKDNTSNSSGANNESVESMILYNASKLYPVNTNTKRKKMEHDESLKKQEKEISLNSVNNDDSKPLNDTVANGKSSNDSQDNKMEIDEKVIYNELNQEFYCISINSQVTIFPKNSAAASVKFESKGMHLNLPRYKKSSKIIEVLLSESRVEHLLVYRDRDSFCFISIITSSELGKSLKEDLKFFKDSSLYCNADVETTKQLKISFLLQNVPENICSLFLYRVYGKKKVTKINHESALEMLATTSKTKKNSCSPLLKSSPTLVYPSVGGIEVKRKDIERLENGRQLNDTIITFYLNYIYHEKISPEMQECTHIFSTYFYDSLEFNNRSKIRTKLETIKSWTKNVDIFSKDFVFIPIQKKKHWFLVVICYLTEMDEGLKPEEIEIDSSSETEEKESPELLNPGLSDDARKTRSSKKLVPRYKRRPCICFFDSSDSGSRLKQEKKNIASTLKEFLMEVWKSKHPDKSLNWDRLLFLKASCPQQKNKYDCGIYLLQYVESFFQKPISYFGDPLPNLKNWFDVAAVKHKRTEIKNLIAELKEKQVGTAPLSPAESNSSSDIIDII